MEKLNKDELILLALELDLGSILKFCASSKRFNEKICQDNNFWRRKLDKERPGIVAILPSDNYREIYTNLVKYEKKQIFANKNLYSVKYTTNPLQILGVVEGFVGFRSKDPKTKGAYFNPPNFYSTGVYYEFINKPKRGDKVWVYGSTDLEGIFPDIFLSKEGAVKILIRKIIQNFPQNDLEKHDFHSYAKKLLDEDYLKLDGHEYLVKQVTIL